MIFIVVRVQIPTKALHSGKTIKYILYIKKKRNYSSFNVTKYLYFNNRYLKYLKQIHNFKIILEFKHSI